jgi:hypothetical protein
VAGLSHHPVGRYPHPMAAAPRVMPTDPNITWSWSRFDHDLYGRGGLIGHVFRLGSLHVHHLRVGKGGAGAKGHRLSLRRANHGAPRCQHGDQGDQ